MLTVLHRGICIGMNPNTEKLMREAAETIVGLKTRVDRLESELAVSKGRTGSTPADALQSLIRKGQRPNLLAGAGIDKNLAAVQKQASSRRNPQS